MAINAVGPGAEFAARSKDPAAAAGAGAANHAARSTAVTIVCAALVWCAFAAVIRGRLVFMHEDLNAALPLRLLASAYYDLVLLASGATAFLLLTYLARRSPRWLRVLRLTWLSVATLMVLLDALNVVVLKFLGTPFTYQWLYYSGFLESQDAQNAMIGMLSWTLVGGAAAVIGLFALCTFSLRAALGFTLSRGIVSHRLFGCAIGAVAVVSLPLARWDLDRNSWNYSKIANPLLAFIDSFVAQRAPPIFTMATPIGSGDFKTVAERSAGGGAEVTPMTGKGRDAGITNVLIFVLESTPAEYVDLYGSPYHATPVMAGLRSRSIVFRNAYAHTPATNASLVSILTGTYPWIAAKFVTEAYPALPIHSLSAELKRRGARTAFFNSADLSFKGAAAFLAHRRFDLVRDDRSIRCDKPLNRAGSSGSLLSQAWDGDGVDDSCTADALIRWVEQDPSRPFFAMMWTMMTHFPYFAGGQETNYGVGDDRLNRYLNGLHAGDAALGRIVDSLDKMGKLDSTLIIVLGDHGEAFGRHGQYVHASKIYEENVHIPLIFINRRLFHGEESSTVVGMEDIAPTVTDLLGLPLPGDWQGRSLFAQDLSPRTYFFTPWADLLFGYREGDYKYIFDATSNSYEVYDLRHDPRETHNLIDLRPGWRGEILDRTAAWVQFQNRMIKHLAATMVAGAN